VSQPAQFAFFLCGAFFFSAASHALDFSDDRGQVLRLTTPAQRIVALAPHLAEIVFAAGAGDRLVGVVRFSDHPSAVQRLPRVGDAAHIDLERIVELRPDLILAWRSGNSPRDVARLEQLGFAVFVTEPARLADIARLTNTIGALTDRRSSAEQASLRFSKKINKLRTLHADKPPVRVFYEIWHRPLLTINGAHLISDVIRLCGGRNVFAGAPMLTPAISLEAVLAARPEVILGGSSSGGEVQFKAQWREVAVDGLRSTPAFYIAPDSIQRHTPRIAEGAAVICQHLDEVRAKRRLPAGVKSGD
jgi:iron complex transport system substrate-binding protein